MPDLTPDTCGTCAFAHMADPQNLLVRECRGSPPTPVLVNVMRNAAGQTGFQIENFRPEFEAKDAACGLFKRKGAGSSVILSS